MSKFPVHEQLEALTEALKADQWTRESGNQWLSPRGDSLNTAYVYGEATVQLGKRLDNGRMERISHDDRYYRGDDLLSWLLNKADKRIIKESTSNFARLIAGPVDEE